jgi:hypothetical protein
MRAALTMAGLMLVVGSLAGCGDDDDSGGSSAPGNASQGEFCEAFNGLFDTVMARDTEADPGAMIERLKDWAAHVEDVGPPDGMPDDARHGFELFVDGAEDLDVDATLEDLQNLGDDLSASDRQDARAFTDWTTDNCPLDLPSKLPSDLPSDLSSDLPSDPSELESMMSDLTGSAGQQG